MELLAAAAVSLLERQMGEMDKEVSRCTVPSCAIPIFDGPGRYQAQYPVLVTDLTGRTYCPRCNRQYVMVCPYEFT
jgi:hypothetical protein